MTDISLADVIVVGAGIAGGAAALQLAQAGVRFVGVDRAPRFGGTARRGGIGSSIAGSPMQAESGISDDWQRAVSDLRAEDNDPNVPWARFYYRRAVHDVYGWYAALGIPFEKVVPHEGDSAPRWHLPLGGGRRTMDTVWTKLGALGAQDSWQFGLAVVDLLMEGDRVVGIEVEDAASKKSRIGGKAVLLATGGFGGNVELGRSSSPRFRDVKRLLAGGNPDARGQLHAIVARHGGLLEKMQDVYAYANGTPDYRDPTEYRGVVVRGPRSSVWVNRNAARFHDEDLIFAGRTATDHLLQQPDQTCWSIFDESALAGLFIQDHYAEPGSETPAEVAERYIAHSPYFRSADTLEELASRTGLPAAALAETIRQWNALLASGAPRDPLTGRDLADLRPIGEGKRWHAVQLFPLLRKTLGGVCTDLHCRVLDNARRPIPGLFAAGELTGMGGGGLAGARPLEGLMAGGSLFTGQVAARWAARYVRRHRS